MNRIGVDWGSTSLRAYLYARDGTVAEQRSDRRGIRFVTAGDFEAVLREFLAGWLLPGSKVALSGMVTSRNGWVETPYVDCPARLEDLSKSLLTRRVADAELVFVPGLCRRGPEPDVMRGEETQLLGLDPAGDRERIVVMPGTHSKWVLLRQGRIESFRTCMTGELYELLLAHSLIGRIAEGVDFSEAAFVAGAERGHASATPVSDLFGARAGVLTASMRAGDVAAYLSGLLVGNEIREGIAAFGAPAGPIEIVGARLLGERYAQALRQLGLSCRIAREDVAARGLWRVLEAVR
ncbi:MAG: 2-dehydro-3-deoxygalactonokinase [Rhizobiaceae bacterium]|nr:2-dehydro-3-deoxygalactonokinase [Rhizobiaceae bacterium]